LLIFTVTCILTVACSPQNDPVPIENTVELTAAQILKKNDEILPHSYSDKLDIVYRYYIKIYDPYFESRRYQDNNPGSVIWIVDLGNQHYIFQDKLVDLNEVKKYQ